MVVYVIYKLFSLKFYQLLPYVDAIIHIISFKKHIFIFANVVQYSGYFYIMFRADIVTGVM